MKIIILIIVFVCLSFFQVPKIIERKNKAELLVFITLMLLGFFLNLSLFIDVEITNPNKIIIGFIEKIK